MKINKKTIIAIVIPVVTIGMAVMGFFAFAHNTPEPNLETTGPEQLIAAPEPVVNCDNSIEPGRADEHEESNKYSKTEEYLKQKEEDDMFWKDKKKKDNIKYLDVVNPEDRRFCIDRTDRAQPSPGGANYIEYQVIAAAETEAEAIEIAQAIGGTVNSFSHGVAVFHIPITVAELMQKLEQENKLHLGVQPNFIYTTTIDRLDRKLINNQ